ncbi:erythromycin esterase family protein [Arthrobacter sp. E918]|uniref:Erythromycin esterase family protein n=1 Tax=Arthrobacter mobilis TaxID=2724944 RepID=A0A7X6HCX3_9MICC|nr:erythromycin esterase family protein [Arthrobacter mobilis]
MRSLARPLAGPGDLDPLIRQVAPDRFVCIGEASHGTHEYYRWRALLSRRLIEEHGFRWVGVEGDWPDCWRINRWVRGQEEQDLDVYQLLAGFERWPRWMWANREVAEFLDWLRRWNADRPEAERTGFYGLDVYSLWDSLREIIGWLQANAPEAVEAAMEAWQCFVPFHEDPHSYAWSTRLVPDTCEQDVVDLLMQVRHRAEERDDDEAAFNALCNAEAAANAENYYRSMVRGDRQSWNVRDVHMADTIARIAEHLGPGSKGLVWEHNTHIGDARATDMADVGMVNVGQLVRQRHAEDGVSLIGFAGGRGSVIAADSWGSAERTMPVPAARPGSHEELLGQALPGPSLLMFDGRDGPWLSAWLGHRAIGVVYDPRRDAGNYVPTLMGERYDALIWFPDTQALQPLQHETGAEGPELETEPTGF